MSTPKRESEVTVHWQNGELLLDGTPARVVSAHALAKGWLWQKSEAELKAAAKAADAAAKAQQLEKEAA